MKKESKKSLFEDIISSASKYFVVAVILILIFICLSGVRFVKSGNVALVLRFGNLVGDTYEEQVHEPGLLLAFPYIVDEVVMVPTGSIIEQEITTHYTKGFMTTLENNGYVITGDQNIALIKANAKYTITDPVKYALKVNDIKAVINASVSNAMVESAACVSVDDILTSGKEKFGHDVVSRAQRKLDIAETGITLKTLELKEVSMPNEVKGIYEKVNAASVQASTKLENAQQYHDTLIPQAEASASEVIAKANSEYSKAVANANTALAEFWGVADEYKTNSKVVKSRIFNEKMSAIMSKIGKVKIVDKGDSKIIID